MSLWFEVEELHRPRSLDEALALLSELGPEAQPLAGGTDVLAARPGARLRGRPRHLVDTSGLGLDYVTFEEGAVRLGAGAPLNRLADGPAFAAGPLRVLGEAARAHSTRTLRNRATLGGNLCNAATTADMPLPLLVLDAVAVVARAGATREIPLERFFLGPNCPALEPGELLLEVRVPAPAAGAGAAFRKLRRQGASVDIAVVNAAALLPPEGGSGARVAVGAAGPTAFRARDAEALLDGGDVSDAALREAARLAAARARPVGDVRASAAYRKSMAEVLVLRCLVECREGRGR